MTELLQNRKEAGAQEHDAEPVRPGRRHLHGMPSRDDLVRMEKPVRAACCGCITMRDGGVQKALLHRRDAQTMHSRQPNWYTSASEVWESHTRRSNHTMKETGKGMASARWRGPVDVRNPLYTDDCNVWASTGRPASRDIQESARNWLTAILEELATERNQSESGRASGGGAHEEMPRAEAKEAHRSQEHRYAQRVEAADKLRLVRQGRSFSKEDGGRAHLSGRPVAQTWSAEKRAQRWPHPWSRQNQRMRRELPAQSHRCATQVGQKLAVSERVLQKREAEAAWWNDWQRSGPRRGDRPEKARLGC